jgi:pimeloyl-ACP methyl ester carboxylesterase
MEANGLSFVVDSCGEGDDVALLLHGFPEARQSWRHQLPALAALGWRAIAPDLRGYGETSRPLGKANYHLDHLTEDVAALFEAAGAKRRLLIGHDWGGIIAWGYGQAGRLPLDHAENVIDSKHLERVASGKPASTFPRPALDGLVVMNAPHMAVYRDVLKRSFRQWTKSWYVAFFQIPGLPEAGMLANGARAVSQAFVTEARDKSRFPPEAVEVYRRNALIPGALTAMINYYRANLTGVDCYIGDGKSPIATPSLLIWGEEDSFLGVECSSGYEPYVTDLTTRRLPGVSHWVQQEAPEAVNAALAEWMRDKGLA